MSIRGLTLLELLIGLLVLGLAAQFTVVPALRQAEGLVLRGIREEVIAFFHRARMEARVHGEARLILSDETDALLVVPDGRPPRRLALQSRGVVVEVQGPRTTVEFRYGPLGVAQFAPATLTLRRGRAETGLVVSGYGRVRR